jgi:T5SS/PEP-CTERM-associated repeat protein/autotransporter-associated beta strand protein
MCLGVSSAAAQPTLWTNPASGDWFAPANWSAGVPDPLNPASLDARIDNGGTAEIVMPGAAVRRLTLGRLSVESGSLMVSGGSLDVAESLFVGEAGDGTLTLAEAGEVEIAGGGGVLDIALQAGSSGVLNVGAGGVPGVLAASEVRFGMGTGAVNFNHVGDAVFDAAINGAGVVSKSGVGTTTLSANSTYSGGTNVFAGELATTNANGLGLGSGPVLVAGDSAALSLGGRVRFRSAATAGAVTIINSPAGFAGGSGGLTLFDNASDAASATIENRGGIHGQGHGGRTEFHATAVAGNATIKNLSATAVSGYGGSTTFFNDSSAGNSNIINSGAGVVFGLSVAGGSTAFSQSSDAGTATIVNDGGMIANSSSGVTTFVSDSSAANAQIFNKAANALGAAGGFTSFDHHTTAANTVIINRGSGVATSGSGGTTIFQGQSSAGSAVIRSEGASATGGTGGATFFSADSTAGAATLYADAGAGGLAPGGFIGFYFNASGGTARAILAGSGANAGVLDISAVPSGVTLGAIEGEGVARLGNRTLSVGAGDLNATYRGSIRDGGALGGVGGSLVKVGGGALTLMGINDYTGSTIVNDGALELVDGGQINNAAGSSVGEAAGTSAAMIIRGAGSLWHNTDATSIGSRGEGSVTVSAGGHLQADVELLVNRFAEGNATLTVTGPGSMVTTGGNLRVADEGSGIFQIAAGGVANSESGYLAPNAATAQATVSILGAGSAWNIAGSLDVGGLGDATLTVGDGGLLSTGFAYVGGYNTSGSGAATVSGANSLWTLNNSLLVGQLGPGQLRIENGGHVSASGGLEIESMGQLIGDGSIQAQVFNNGSVTPGGASGAMSIDGDYTQAGMGSLRVNIGSAMSFSRLDVSGEVALAGVLTVTLAQGYVPSGQQSFDILDWDGGLTGTFDSIEFPTLGGLLTWDDSQLYTAGILSVTGSVLDADFDEDGDVDGNDLTKWESGFGMSSAASHTSGDADSDQDVDGRDFLVWQQQTGVAPPVTSTPEPTATSLIAIGILAAAASAGRNAKHGRDQTCVNKARS